MYLLLARHGETNKNVAKQSHFHNDPEELNERGVKESLLLADLVKFWSPKIIISCSEVRAVQTVSHVLSKHPNLEIKLDARLQERNWGDWNGKPWSFISEKLDSMTIDERYNFIPPNGESWKMFEARLLGLINELVAKDENVLLVTHKGGLRALTAKLLFNNKEQHQALNQKNGSLLVFKSGANLDFELEHFSNPF